MDASGSPGGGNYQLRVSDACRIRETLLFSKAFKGDDH